MRGIKDISLGAVLDQVTSLDDEMCIFAKKPWSLDSEAIVGRLEGNEFRIPQDFLDEGFEYFLEVHVAKEVLEVLDGHPETAEMKRNLLLFYAENDAYPEWVYN